MSSQNEIINIIRITDKVKNLESKKTVDHMRSRTTTQTMKLVKNAEKQLLIIGAEIANILEKNPDIDIDQQIRPKFKTRVGSIIANTIRESHLLGIHFIESSENQTVQLTQQMVQEMNQQIEDEINRYWNFIKTIQQKQLQKKFEEDTKVQGAAFGFDMAGAFNGFTGGMSVSMGFSALGNSTIQAQTQAYQQQIQVGNLEVRAQASIQAPKMLWVSERDGRVCPICQNLDGRSWSIDDASMPRPVTSTHFNCRCRLLPEKGGRAFNG